MAWKGGAVATDVVSRGRNPGGRLARRNLGDQAFSTIGGRTVEYRWRRLPVDSPTMVASMSSRDGWIHARAARSWSLGTSQPRRLSGAQPGGLSCRRVRGSTVGSWPEIRPAFCARKLLSSATVGGSDPEVRVRVRDGHRSALQVVQSLGLLKALLVRRKGVPGEVVPWERLPGL